MKITSDKIELIYKVEKICAENVKWHNTTKIHYEHMNFILPVITVNGEILTWIGYYQNRFGKKEYGFNLKYMNKYCVRSWDMAKSHKSVKEGKYIRGIGCHKHYYLNKEVPRDIYGIPQGEISIVDPNQAVIDFAKECNINMLLPYQNQIFI